MTLNEEQQRVYEWLNDKLELPVFAEAYKGAVILLRQKQAGYVSFVAHAGRDLMNRLASTHRGIQSKQVQYVQHLDGLMGDWQDKWGYSDDLSSEIKERGHYIPVQVCQKISTLIEEHKSGRARSSEADGLFFSTFLDYSDRDMIPINFLGEWKSAKDWFVKHAHLREGTFRIETEGDLEKHFTCLHDYLHTAASSQYERLKVLDEILDATNS